MKFTKLFAAAMCLAAVATACQEPEESVTPNNGEGLEIAVSAQMYNFNKATDTAFEEGDEIGLHIVIPEGTHLENAKYTYTEGALVAAESYYWHKNESTEASVYAYYPYNASAKYGVAGYTFTVEADQSVEGGYAASDLLIASTASKPTTEVVALPFRHALSKVVINIESELEEAVESVMFADVYGSATINFANGNAAVNGQKGTIKAAKVADKESYTLIVVPQTEAQPRILVTVGDKQYNFNIEVATDFVAGKVATANIALTKNLVGTEFSAEITDWVGDSELQFNPSEENTPGEGGEGGEGGEPVDPELPEEPESTAHKIYVYNYAGWNTINIYSWDGAGTPSTGVWPGTAITATEEINGYTYYVYTMPAELDGAELGVIFNNGSAQTPDYTVTLNKDYYLRVEGSVAPVEIEDINNPEPTVEKIARTITVTYSGSALYLYWWVGGASWPGTAMESVDGKFVYTFDKAMDGASISVIFNNNAGGQTADITGVVLDKDHEFVLNNDWSYEWITK